MAASRSLNFTLISLSILSYHKDRHTQRVSRSYVVRLIAPDFQEDKPRIFFVILNWFHFSSNWRYRGGEIFFVVCYLFWLVSVVVLHRTRRWTHKVLKKKKRPHLSNPSSQLRRPPVSVVKLNEPNTRNILILHGGEEVLRVRSVDRREEVSSFQLLLCAFFKCTTDQFIRQSRKERRTECFPLAQIRWKLQK